MTTLKFQALLFLDEIRPVAAAEVASQWTEGLRQLKIRPEEVEIRKWPIHHAVVDCVVGDKVLASYTTRSLTSVDKTIDFALDFSADALAEFKTAAQAEEVEFVFAYAFENSEVAKGEVTIRASRTVSRVVNDVLRNTLTPAQRDGSQPILMKQKQEISQTSRLNATRTVRLQHKELLPLLNEQNSLTEKFFAKQDPIKWDELLQNDLLRAELAKVLPLVQSWAESDQKTQKTRGEREHKVEVTTKTNGGFTFKLPVVSADVNGGVEKTTTDMRRDLLEREYGIITTKSKDGKYYAPIAIQTFKWVGGKNDVAIDESMVVYLAVGTSDQLLEDSPVPITYTSRKLRQLLASAKPKKIKFGPSPEEKLSAADWNLKKAQAQLGRSKAKVVDIEHQLKAGEAMKRARENDALTKKQAREAADTSLSSVQRTLHRAEKEFRDKSLVYQLLKPADQERLFAPIRDKSQPAIDAAQQQLRMAQESEALAHRQLAEATAKVSVLQSQLTEAQKTAQNAEQKVEEATESVEKLRAAQK